MLASVHVCVCVLFLSLSSSPSQCPAHFAESGDNPIVAEGSAGSFSAHTGTAAVRGDAEED